MSGDTAQDRRWAGRDGENARDTEAVPALGWSGWGVGWDTGAVPALCQSGWGARRGIGAVPALGWPGWGSGMDTGAVPALCWPGYRGGTGAVLAAGPAVRCSVTSARHAGAERQRGDGDGAPQRRGRSLGWYRSPRDVPEELSGSA